MTEFEYFSAMIAVILALGVTHILRYVSHVALNPGLVIRYWVHSAWVLLVLLAHFAAWWNIWELGDDLRFSLYVFLYMLIGPIALFLAARLIVPPLHGPAQLDTETHYYSVHRLFFALLGAFIIWPSLLGIHLQDSVSMAGIIRHLALLAPIVVCAFSANRRLHAFVAALVGIAILVDA